MKNYISIFILLTVCTTACQNKSNAMQSYEWTATRSAPKSYPMEIVEGRFIFEDGSSQAIPKRGVAKNGWGKPGPTRVNGDRLKEVPRAFEVTYLSFTENQFYRGQFELNSKAIDSLFKTTYPSIYNNSNELFNEFNVGVAPGGTVTLWISGPAKQQEIGSYKASKVDMTMEEFNPTGIQDREVYVNTILEQNLSTKQRSELTTKGVPLEKWSAYRKKYLWQPIVQPPSGKTVEYIITHHLNGEKETFIERTLEQLKAAPRAVPNYVSFFWEDASKNKFGARIYFDEKEMLTAYEALAAEGDSEPLLLYFEPDRYNSRITIALKNSENSIQIEKGTIKIFDKN